MPTDIEKATLTTAEACRLLDIGRTWLNEVAGEAKRGRDTWSLVGVVRARVAYVQQQMKRERAAAAENRVALVRAIDIEERTRARATKLIGCAESIEATRDIVHIIREEAAGVTGRKFFPGNVAAAAGFDRDFAEIFSRADAKLDQVAEAVRTGTTLRHAGRPWNS